MDIDSVADALYALPVAQFTAERDAQAARARKAGDTELAAAIKQLRKPTAGAALANLLVRAQREEIEALLDIGARLQQAQRDLDADEMRELSQQRRTALTDLVATAKEVADDNDQPAGGTATAELRATLEAASADAAAAAELRLGRLTKGLQFTGFGGGIGAATAAPTTSRKSASGPKKKATQVTSLDSRRTLRDAQAAATQARDDCTAADHAVSEARLRTEDRRRAVMDLEQRLLSAREALTTAKRELASAQHTHAAAQRKLEQAERAVEKAQRAVDRGST